MNLNKAWWIPLFFISFVFIVSIVLFNLLNALAISDTQQILDEGEITDLCIKIDVLKSYDEMVAKPHRKFFKKLHRKLTVFDKTKTRKIAISLSDCKVRFLTHEVLGTQISNEIAFTNKSVIKRLEIVDWQTRENKELESLNVKNCERMKKVEKLLNEIFAKTQTKMFK